MTVEVSSRDDLERTIVDEDFQSFVFSLNGAAVNGKQFVITNEVDRGPVALEIKNITRIRDLGTKEDGNAYIG